MVVNLLLNFSQQCKVAPFSKSKLPESDREICLTIFCALKARFGSQKVSPSNAQPKRSCYVAARKQKTVKQLCGERGNQEERTEVLRGRSAK